MSSALSLNEGLLYYTDHFPLAFSRNERNLNSTPEMDRHWAHVAYSSCHSPIFLHLANMARFWGRTAIHLWFAHVAATFGSRRGFRARCARPSRFSVRANMGRFWGRGGSKEIPWYLSLFVVVTKLEGYQGIMISWSISLPSQSLRRPVHHPSLDVP